jgi:hypothetical protein
MLLKNAALAVLFTLAAAFPALAQPANVAEINFQTPKPGQTAQYEAARKKHNGWHSKQNDAWAWLTWEVLTGPDTGHYVTGSFGHAWKDFDPREKILDADAVDFGKTVGPTLAVGTTSYFLLRGDMSLSVPTPGMSPAPMATISLFLLRPDGVTDFVEAVKKVNEGIKKTNYPQSGASRWYQLVNGGDGPLFVLSADRANWAAFQANDKTLDAMMEEAYGKEPGAAILASLRKAVHSVSSRTIKYRADLSYLPAAK